MPSKNYAAPLCLEPRISKRLVLLFACALCGALLLPLLVAAPGWLQLTFALASLGTAYPGYRAAFGNRRITRAVWDELGAWHLELADGTGTEAELVGESFVTPEGMVLGFRASGRRFHLVVLADTLDPETCRRLRVRLRLEGTRRAASAPPP